MYASQSDLEKRLEPQTLVDLTDDDRDGAADAAVVTAALEDASAQVDLHLAARYTIPVASPSALLTELTCAIAVHALFGRRRASLSPDHAQRHAAALRTLGDIANARLSLPEADLRDLAESTRRNDSKVFSRESLEGY